MKIEQQIDLLERLSQVDAELATVEQELAAARKSRSDQEQKLGEVSVRLEATELSVVEMERTRSEVTIELRNLGQQIERSRDKLGRSRSEREVNAAQRELEELRKLQRDRDTEVQKLSGLVEQARAEHQRLSDEHKRIGAELDSSAGELGSRVQQLEASLVELQTRRAGVAKELPSALYRKYETIRMRRTPAVAHTSAALKGTCSACHVSFPPMMTQKLLRREGLEQCPSCVRILYYQDAPTDEAQGDAEAHGA